MTNELVASQTKALQTSLKGALMQRKTFLLLDCSGSMNESASAECRKIDSLRSLVNTLRTEYEIGFRQITFGVTVDIQDDIPEPGGGTPLHKALELAKENGPRKVVVVSDGFPDDANAAIKVAEDMGIPIDTYYVGPTPSEGEGFMRRLAEATKGTNVTGNLGEGLRMLTGEVRKSLLMLPAPIAL